MHLPLQVLINQLYTNCLSAYDIRFTEILRSLQIKDAMALCASY